MKKKIEQMAREDWEKTAASAKEMYRKSMELSGLCSGNFGKAHHAAKKAYRLYELMKELKSEMDDLAYEYAKELFNEKEIDSLFYGG